MKAFFIKHKSTILYWAIFLCVLFIFVPRQKALYLEADINRFKDEYFVPALFWTWAAICTLFLILLFRNTKSIKDSAAAFLYASFIAAFFLFVFKDIFLGGLLFINKLYKTDDSQKVYSVLYINNGEQNEANFLLLDIAAEKTAYDEKLKEKLYHPELKSKDTVRLPVNIGLLGIPFPSE